MGLSCREHSVLLNQRQTALYYPRDKQQICGCNTKGISFHSASTDAKWALMTTEKRRIQILIMWSPLIVIVGTVQTVSDSYCRYPDYHLHLRLFMRVREKVHNGRRVSKDSSQLWAGLKTLTACYITPSLDVSLSGNSCTRKIPIKNVITLSVVFFSLHIFMLSKWTKIDHICWCSYPSSLTGLKLTHFPLNGTIQRNPTTFWTASMLL